jgi:transcriptional regulator with XRE-family HTH domain
MSPRDAASLAKSIRRHREAAGLSINALAREARLPPSTVLRLEAGEIEAPDPDKLQRLAAALAIDPEEFFAHYPAPEKLPDFAPYLRAKYGMSAEAVAEAEQFFAELESRQKPKRRKGGRRGNRAR